MEVLESPWESPRSKPALRPHKTRSRRPIPLVSESGDASEDGDTAKQGKTTNVSWEVLKRSDHMYCPRFDHAITRRHQQFFLFGGNTGMMASKTQFLNDLYQYDFQNQSWLKVKVKSTCPPARAGHTMVAHHRRLHIYGGIGRVGTLDDFWSYDPEDTVWGRRALQGCPMPPARAHHTSIIHENGMFVYGGCESEGSGVVWRLDMLTKSWELFCPGQGVFGEGKLAVSKKVDAKDVETLKHAAWDTQSEVLPRPRRMHTATIYNNQMYIFGGVFLNTDDVITNELWQFDLQTTRWTNLTPKAVPDGTPSLWPVARASHAASLAGTRWIIHGGRTHASFLFKPAKAKEGTAKAETALPTSETSTVQIDQLPEQLQFGSHPTIKPFYLPTSYQVPLGDIWVLQIPTLTWELLKESADTVEDESELACRPRWGHKLLISHGVGGQGVPQLPATEERRRTIIVTGGVSLTPVPLL